MLTVAQHHRYKHPGVFVLAFWPLQTLNTALWEGAIRDSDISFSLCHGPLPPQATSKMEDTNEMWCRMVRKRALGSEQREGRSEGPQVLEELNIPDKERATRVKTPGGLLFRLQALIWLKLCVEVKARACDRWLSQATFYKRSSELLPPAWQRPHGGLCWKSDHQRPTAKAALLALPWDCFLYISAQVQTSRHR